MKKLKDMKMSECKLFLAITSVNLFAQTWLSLSRHNGHNIIQTKLFQTHFKTKDSQHKPLQLSRNKNKWNHQTVQGQQKMSEVKNPAQCNKIRTDVFVKLEMSAYKREASVREQKQRAPKKWMNKMNGNWKSINEGLSNESSQNNDTSLCDQHSNPVNKCDIWTPNTHN